MSHSKEGSITENNSFIKGLRSFKNNLLLAAGFKGKTPDANNSWMTIQAKTNTIAGLNACEELRQAKLPEELKAA